LLCVVGLEGFPFCIRALTSLGMKLLARSQGKTTHYQTCTYDRTLSNICLIPRPNWAIFVPLLDKQTKKVTNVLSKENRGRGGWVIIHLLQKVWNQKALDHFLVPAPHLPQFLVCFECFKTWQVRQLGFTKLLCILEAKMQPSKILSLKSYSILTHPSPNTKPPSSPNIPYLSTPHHPSPTTLSKFE
jgi:hypothetical protein